MTQPARAIRKFNPGTGQSDAELVRQFVVREKELEVALDILRSNIDAPCCQNTLVVAPRGAGKTMLLARIAAELRANDAFSQYLLPVRFMEESFEAYDIGEFWLEALFHLALEVESSAPDLATELRQSHQELCDHWRPDLATQALATLLDAADQLDRRLVLLVENLADLCRDVDDDFGWALRGVLQTEPRLMLLSSATTRFQELDDASEPFFELFRFVYLKPLDSAACLRLWQTVSGNVASEQAIRPLEIFTGGSPRLLVMVAEFAGHRSLPQLMDELVTLIDHHTEYFRGHLERLPKGEKRVYVAIIDLWQPSSTGEIAQRARMDVRTTSTCIGRLVGRGMVSLRGSGSRKRYVATERLYSIYYKLRRERDEATVVRNLIRFMVAFYSRDELIAMSEDFVRGAWESTAVSKGIAGVLADEPVFVDVFESGLLPPLKKAVREGRFEEALTTCERALSGPPLPPVIMWRVLWAKAVCFDAVGDYDGEVALYDDFLQRYGARSPAEDDALPPQIVVIWAWGNKGAILGRLGKTDDAVATLRELLRTWGDCKLAEAQEHLALAHLNLGVGLEELGDIQSAVDAYEAVDRRFADASDSRIQYWVATALVNLGAVLSEERDQWPRAIRTYDDAIARFGNVDHSDLQRSVAMALFNRGVAYEHLGDQQSAMASWSEVVKRSAGFSNAGTISVVVNAKLAKANGLARAGSYGDAHAELGRIVHEFGRLEEDGVRALLGRALVARCAVELDLGRPADALETCATLERGFADLRDERFVWYARFHAARAHFALGDIEQGRAAFDLAYQAFTPTGRAVHQLGLLVFESFLAGVPARVLADTLSSADDRALAAIPVLVALLQEAGEDVRAPEEFFEVAADVRASWHKHRVPPVLHQTPRGASATE